MDPQNPTYVPQTIQLSVQRIFFTTRTVPARNVDGRVITSNWFSNCLFMRPERSQNRTEPTKKSMCDMCGYYGHVWHISHAPPKITNFRTVVNYCDIFWAFQKAPEKAVHLEQSPSWQSWSWKIQDMKWMSPSGNQLEIAAPWPMTLLTVMQFSSVSCPCPLQEYTQSLP